MTDHREVTRAEARKRRMIAKIVASQKADVVFERIASVLNKTHWILADEDFAKILGSQGIRTIPPDRAAVTSPPAVIDNKAGTKKEVLDAASLEFVIVWSFMFPLFSNPTIASDLERICPGFIMELKDAFITLVVEGPFPHVMSGHHGRRHSTHYQSESRRRSKYR
jgi:hypothetical protein